MKPSNVTVYLDGAAKYIFPIYPNATVSQLKQNINQTFGNMNYTIKFYLNNIIV